MLADLEAMVSTMSVFTTFVKCCMGETECCACGADERVLRAYIRNDSAIGSMSDAQRRWCFNEIGSVEGYDKGDYVRVEATQI